MQGVYEGFGGNFGTIAYSTPDYDKLLHIERNVYQFSTAKDWHMKKELTQLVRTTKNFNEFKVAAASILEEYTIKHLRTEYNAVVAGSQMASKWVDFEKGAELRKEAGLSEPLLEYRTQEDARVRESHRALNRITRPVSDNFWKTYYPPNGWNCRCTTVRLNKGDTSTDQETNQAMANVIPQKGFGVNLAKEGMVLPMDIVKTGVPPVVIAKADDLIPYERRFETMYESRSGGKVYQHAEVKTKERDNNPYNRHLTMSKELADQGHTIHLLPELDENLTEKRKALLPGVKGNHNPDLLFNGKYADYKLPESATYKAISDNIKKSCKQGAIPIIDIAEFEADDAVLENVCKGAFNARPKLQLVIFRTGKGKFTEYPREYFK
jgi:SPP1 gp7 family putative phage head morphogenesis protein